SPAPPKILHSHCCGNSMMSLLCTNLRHHRHTALLRIQHFLFSPILLPRSTAPFHRSIPCT
ncbi:MAG: hypothetical protein PUE64_08775, partial [Firmicutes bacterium]|nr:hypothetical protein [Bacillota bacterium]